MATIGSDGHASYEFDLAWRLNPVAYGLDAAGRAHLLARRGDPPGADDVLELLGRLRGATTISYDVNARPAITGTGPDLVAQVEAVAALQRPREGLRRGPRGALRRGRPHRRREAAARPRPGCGGGDPGPGGATWLTPTQEVDVASVPVVVADTIGGG